MTFDLNVIKWWVCTLLVDSSIEDLISSKLIELKIIQFSIEILNDSESPISKFSLWIENDDFVNINQKEFDYEIKLISNLDKKDIIISDWELVSNKDWSKEWKSLWSPQPIGNKLLIQPAWLPIPDKFNDRTVIRIDPGYAFGTGEHPTTKLCLQEIENLSIQDKDVLDFGSGSGILSITAIKLGAKKTYLVDNDYYALNASLENLSLNSINSNSYDIINNKASNFNNKIILSSIDLIFCNTLMPIIKDNLLKLIKILKPEGTILLSGILVEQVPEIMVLIKEFNLSLKIKRDMESWTILKLSRDL